MDGWMARRGQEDHNGWRSLLEGVMTILILIRAKCIIKIVVPAFPLNRHQELICLLASWPLRGCTAPAALLLIDKAVVESRWVMMIFVLRMLYLTLIDTSSPLPQTKQRQMLKHACSYGVHEWLICHGPVVLLYQINLSYNIYMQLDIFINSEIRSIISLSKYYVYIEKSKYLLATAVYRVCMQLDDDTSVPTNHAHIYPYLSFLQGLYRADPSSAFVVAFCLLLLLNRHHSSADLCMFQDECKDKEDTVNGSNKRGCL